MPKDHSARGRRATQRVRTGDKTVDRILTKLERMGCRLRKTGGGHVFVYPPGDAAPITVSGNTNGKALIHKREQLRRAGLEV
jgi:hypothetical protein